MIKRYETQYVHTYIYNDNGQEDRIVFKANAGLFPLFKSISGQELTDCLNDYTQSMIDTLSPQTAEFIARFETATTEEKESMILEDAMGQEILQKALQSTVQTAHGLSFVELLLISMHVCALPEDERSEALGLGIELLPDKAYEDMELIYSLLELVVKFEQKVKKKSSLTQAKIII